MQNLQEKLREGERERSMEAFVTLTSEIIGEQERERERERKWEYQLSSDSSASMLAAAPGVYRRSIWRIYTNFLARKRYFSQLYNLVTSGLRSRILDLVSVYN